MLHDRDISTLDIDSNAGSWLPPGVPFGTALPVNGGVLGSRYDEENDVFSQNATTGRVLNKVLGDLGDT